MTTPTVTKQTVATAAGVSWKTVQRAINDPGLVDPETLAKVKAAIEETGFTGDGRVGRVPHEIPLVHAVSLRVDERTRAELERRGQALGEVHRAKTRGWDSEVVRLALDWAFNPPEGVAPMPDDYLGHVDRITPSP